MKTNKNQKGFSAIELILLVVIVLGLGGIGWYVINSNHKTQKQLDSLAKTSDTSSASKASNNKASQNPAPTSNELTIKELGVKIHLSNDLKGLSYTYVKEGSDSSGYAALTSPTYKDALTKCPQSPLSGEDPTDYSFATITRHSGTYTGSDVLSDVSGELLKQFDNVFFTADYPNGVGCEDQAVSENIKDTGGNLSKSVYDAFQTATLVQ